MADKPIQRGGDKAEQLLARGAALLRDRRSAEAARVFQELAERRPNDSSAHRRLGDALAWAGELPGAAAALRRAVELDERNSRAMGRLGNVLRMRNDPEGAVEAFARAAAIEPDSVELLCNLGEALVVAGHADQSIAPLERAVEIDPKQPIAHLNLGCALMRLRRPVEATERFERAVSLKPDLAQAHLNLGMAWLMRGEYLRGWPELEWRLRRSRLAETRKAGQGARVWRGRALEGQTILLHAEQGYGDAFQFARYIPMVARRGGRVLLSCRWELSALLGSARGVAEVVVTGEPSPAFDLQCPLMSLPRAFASTIETLPRDVPYLRAPADAVSRWAQRLAGAGGMKIGIAWAGSPTNTRNRYRSMRFDQIAPLLDCAGVAFINLQKDQSGDALRQSAHSARVIDPTADMHDWSDTAALLENLDLIITVDTAIAHLAGALARPTWTLLSFGADWRWLLDRDDSPWYPTMRLFRQETLGNWPSVVDCVKEALKSAELPDDRSAG